MHRDRLKLYDTIKVCCPCHSRYSNFKQLLEAATDATDKAKKIRMKEKKVEKELSKVRTVTSTEKYYEF